MVQSYSTGGANVPSWKDTLSSPRKYDWTYASFGHPSPQPKRQVSRSSRLYTAHGRKSLYFAMGDPFPKNCPFLWEGSGPHLIHDSFSQIESTVNRISIGSAVFAQVTAECPYTLQWAPLSTRIAPSHGGSGTHLTRDSLGPYEPTNQTASLSVQPFLHRWPHSVHFAMGRPFPPQNCPFPLGYLVPHPTHGSLGPPESSTQMASRSVQPF